MQYWSRYGWDKENAKFKKKNKQLDKKIAQKKKKRKRSRGIEKIMKKKGCDEKTARHILKGYKRKQND